MDAFADPRDSAVVPGRGAAAASMRGLGIGAIVLFGLSVLVDAWGAVSDWHTFLVVRDYLGYAPGIGEADLRAADVMAQRAAVLGPAALVAAGVGFLRWLWHARANTAHAPHRYPRVWAMVAWFCPVVNLWHPPRVVSDVWRASAPPGAGRGRRLITAWWLCWIASGTIDAALFVWFPRTSPELEPLRAAALLSSVSSASYLVSAVLLATIVVRISRWQDRPWPPAPVRPAPVQGVEPDELLPIVD